MEKDDLVHADAAKDLSQSGQLHAGPNRCSDRDIQIGIDYLIGDRNQGTEHYKNLHRVIVFLEAELRKRRSTKQNKRPLPASPRRSGDRPVAPHDGK